MTRDEHGAEMLDVIFNNVYLDFNCIYVSDTTRSKLDSIIHSQRSADFNDRRCTEQGRQRDAKFISNWDAE